MKRPIMLISTEGKSVEQIKNEAKAALVKYQQANEPEQKNQEEKLNSLTKSSKK